VIGDWKKNAAVGPAIHVEKMDARGCTKHLVKNDSDENFQYSASGGTGGGTAGGDWRGVAGTEPQRETTAVGTAESAKPEADARDCRGAGHTADACEFAGTGAGAAECGDGGAGTGGETSRSAAGGDGAAGAASRVGREEGERRGIDRLAAEVAGGAPTGSGKLRGACGGGILRIWAFAIDVVP